MEVHHPHHLSHKKNWKEYFLEFLMLFLAVFLGFLAENIRETYIERHREKEYIIGLIQNLKADTTDIARVIERNILKTEVWYSLLHLARQDLSDHSNDVAFYEKFIKGAIMPVFRPNDATLIQLKNSGNLRLVNKKDVADSILSYDKKNERIIKHNDYLEKSNDFVWDAAYPLLDAWVFADSTYLDFSSRKFLRTDLPEITYNLAHKKLLIGNLTRTLLLLRVNRIYLIEQREKATKLIKFLESKYHL
jgi:hypothetical protein